MSLLHIFMAQGICLITSVGIGNVPDLILLGILTCLWFGYYKLTGFIVVLVLLSLLYVFLNLDTFAAQQLKESIVEENYRYIFNDLLGNL